MAGKRKVSYSIIGPAAAARPPPPPPFHYTFQSRPPARELSPSPGKLRLNKREEQQQQRRRQREKSCHTMHLAAPCTVYRVGRASIPRGIGLPEEESRSGTNSQANKEYYCFQRPTTSTYVVYTGGETQVQMNILSLAGCSWPQKTASPTTQ